VDHRVGLDDVEKRKFLPNHRDLNSNPSVVQPVASRGDNMSRLLPGGIEKSIGHVSEEAGVPVEGTMCPDICLEELRNL
jgi:hypothetical protein